MMTYTVALNVFLAGIYYDWRLCVVAVFVLMGGIVNMAFSNLTPYWRGSVRVQSSFTLFGVWIYNCWCERLATQQVIEEVRRLDRNLDSYLIY